MSLSSYWYCAGMDVSEKQPSSTRVIVSHKWSEMRFAGVASGFPPVTVEPLSKPVVPASPKSTGHGLERDFHEVHPVSR